MKRKVSAVDARRRLGEILESVYYRGDEVVIMRAGKPMAVVIPAERYEALERTRERVFKLVERAQENNKDVPYEVIEQEVAAALGEVRKGGRNRAAADTAQ